MTLKSILLALGALFLTLTPVLGATVQTTVKYVSASGIYIDAGRAQGIQKGDAGEIRRDGGLVAHIEIAFVADRSASCTVMDSTGEIRAGDEVVVTTAAVPEVVRDTTVTATTPEVTPPPATPKAEKRAAKNRLTGRIAVQNFGQYSADDLNYDYAQPSLVLRARVENLLGTQHTLNVRLRTRRNLTDSDLAGRNQRDWYNRVYEVSLSYDPVAAPYSYAVGRMLTNRLSGIGYLDGARFEYDWSSRFSTGLFAGTQPDLSTSDVRTERTKGGLYAAWQQVVGDNRRLGATVAAAGEYHNGEISREFLYQQFDYSAGQTLSLYESAELGVHRGWQKDVEGGALSLDNLLMNVRYAPVRAVALRFGYDSRTPYRTWESRTLADSLFDDALQQGYRAGVDLRLPYAIDGDVSVGLRTTSGESARARTLALGLGTRNLLGQRIGLYGRLNRYTNRFTEGQQAMLRLSRQLTARWNAGVQAGRDQYDLKSVNQRYSANWLKLETDVYLTRHLYGSAYGELYRGKPFEGTRSFVELGWRF